MLVSAVIHLELADSAELPGPCGREIQAWFLGQVSRHSASLAEALHASSEQRPYTVSSLMEPDWRRAPEGKPLHKGAPFVFRITSLMAEVSGMLLGMLLPNLPEALHLRNLDFRITGWTVSPHEHPWAHHLTYGEIVKQAEQENGRRVKLFFATPTAFRLNHHDLALPSPASVLRSWWVRWNKYAPAPMQIDPSWPKFAADCVLVDYLREVNTLRWRFPSGLATTAERTATGYVGEVGFYLLPRSSSEEWKPFWPGALQVFNALSNYALFCGTGHHTTVGMGQTKRIENSNQ